MARRRAAPRIKVEKRKRRKRVYVRGYCRRKGERAWKTASRKAKEWGF